mmetsp:Transcript_46372/g.75368  ORF Transcript_46372/g.75368 Transcript_46372/m.75368 type:complete len:239 (-) Transcript_46372:566-1282(-)
MRREYCQADSLFACRGRNLPPGVEVARCGPASRADTCANSSPDRCANGDGEAEGEDRGYDSNHGSKRSTREETATCAKEGHVQHTAATSALRWLPTRLLVAEVYAEGFSAARSPSLATCLGQSLWQLGVALRAFGLCSRLDRGDRRRRRARRVLIRAIICFIQFLHERSVAAHGLVHGPPEALGLLARRRSTLLARQLLRLLLHLPLTLLKLPLILLLFHLLREGLGFVQRFMSCTRS